jgi:hypothetical protein
MTISSAQQLSLFSGALREIGSRALASLTENREPQYLLTAVWNDDAVLHCLEEGLWSFAIRSVAISYDPSYTADFGFTYRFNQPSDFVRTSQVAMDEYFEQPLTRYVEEGQFWFSDLSQIFVKYVSDDPNYGMNYNVWPPSFIVFVELYLASKIVFKITQSKEKEDEILQKLNMARRDALSKTAMEQPNKFFPLGMFSKARLGIWGRTRNSGGN